MTEDSRPRFAAAAVLAIAAVRLLLWALFARNYGYFRDELYYLDCARHLAWGYVDQPPMIAWVTWVVRHTIGDSLHAIRFLPALAQSATIVVAAKLAREMGGRVWAQIVAAVCVLVAPMYLTISQLLTMNAWEPLSWMLLAWIVLRIIRTGDQRLWLLFGLVAGIALENKYTVALFGASVVLGLLLSSQRRALVKPWIWLGGVLAFLIFLPNLLWQWHRQWPFAQLIHNVRASGRDIARGPVAFTLDQAVAMNPLVFIIAIVGLAWLFTRSGRRYRIVAWTFLTVYITFVVLHGKNYYVAPVYPMMFAAGAVALEQWFASRTLRGVATAWVALAVALSAFALPMFVPVLSPERYMAYTRATHLAPPAFEHQQNGPLNNQIYADMYGWDEMARVTAAALQQVPAELRARTAIFANDYGQASAIDFFGPKYGLPTAISPHQTYWYWGPRGYTGESVLILRDTADNVAGECADWKVVGHVAHPYSRRDEHFDIYWCHNLKWNLQEVWPRMKRFN